MKCPNCKFVSSNTRDTCPRCEFDLRPHKQALGLPINNSKPTPEKLKPVVTQVTTSQAPAPTQFNLPENDLSLSDLEQELSLTLNKIPLSSTTSGLQAVEDNDIKALFELDELDDEPIITLPNQSDPPEKIIENYATSMQDNLSEATLATSELTTFEFSESPEGNSSFQSPTVAPSVLDLSEDDALFDETLNAILGDTIFDVEAVKPTKAATSSPSSIQTLVEDDLEITFEVEMEEKEDKKETKPSASVTETPAKLDDDFLTGLTEALNTIESQTKQVTVAAQVTTNPDALVTTFENELKTPVASPDPKEFLSKITAADANNPEVFNQLMGLLKQAYGVNIPNNIQITPGDISSLDPDLLKSLESELDQELKALLGDGTSFSKTFDPPPLTPEPVVSEIDQLQEDLSSELELLASDGMTVYQNQEEIITAAADETPNNEPILEEPLALQSSSIDEIWQDVSDELDSINLDDQEQELSFSELASIKPNEKLDLLFDLTEEELSNPHGKPDYIEAIPTSNIAKVDNTNLNVALKNFDKDVIRAEKKLSQIQKLRDSGIIDRREVETKLKDLPKGGRIRRTLGLAVDLVYNTIVGLGLTYLLYLPQTAKDALITQQIITLDEIIPHIFAAFGFIYASWIILSVILIAGRGQTVGQKWLGLEVVNLRGEPVNLGQAFVRSLAQVTTLLTLGLGILPIFSKNQQTLHDLLSKTAVKRC